jgi:hypothetical protein
MVRTAPEKPASVYYCEICGYGYADEKTAESCEEYCSAHNACSFEITSKAIQKPSL